MAWEGNVKWHAWSEWDEPSRAITLSNYVLVDAKDGVELAETVVWQKAVNNDVHDTLWQDGAVIVEIVEPQEAAGFYLVEVETKTETKGDMLSPDDVAEITSALKEAAAS